jgi:hypothetical protein
MKGVGVSSRTLENLYKKIDHEAEINAAQEKQIAAIEETVKEIAEMRRDIKEILRRTPR